MSSQRKVGRQPKKYSQAARLHDLIRILENRYGATVEELVEECEVTRRTIYRDLKAIEEAGYPLISERQDDGQVLYSFIEGYNKIPPITFSLEELMTLYLCRGQLDFLQGTPFHDDLEAIFTRFRSSLPPRSVAHLERLAKASAPRFHGFKDYSGQRQLLTDLRQALLKQQRIEIAYRPAKRKRNLYQVDPYTLLFFKNALYLGGYAHNREALRLFAVERIESLSFLPDRFEVPEDYSATALTGEAFGLIDDGATQQVELQFDKEVTYLIRERIWHPQQQLQKGADGNLILRFDAAGDKEILSWVYSFVPHVRVLGPESLKQQFIAGLMRGLEYQNGE
ncbi:Predicted DNA-binding transcriptional regulator YafY, contains an HTH and WYL domains [Malonomonas rubra DSM 5091]|uniref:Predicted DNA-binding transcriptional regulator YafY, contains an HTH and WYL domains n=1 Tax=Malonomonas rubra DSM 5091 TaxID=1122189 RepID=A0A1M6BUD0_MALRU|nr:transcriptional regulator [Malonomonas rubra]SHI52339.1 Predicted DNA-binding transcriptional regulator YafY, contains an HTH and WYL domains [Malonomonas rubra DSM 5091]